MPKKQKRDVPLDEQLDERVKRTAEWLKDSTLSPEEILEKKEIRTIILDAIGALALEQRAMIVMRYFLERSEADMSTPCAHFALSDCRQYQFARNNPNG